MTWYSHQLVTGIVRSYTRFNQNATVRIMRMTDPVLGFDDESLNAVPSGVVYVGPGRVYTVSGPVQFMLGEEPQYFSSTYVSVPDTHVTPAADGGYDVGDPVLPRVDDVIEVVAHHDVRTQGTKLRVTDVQSAGQFHPFVVMTAVGAQWSKRWDHPSADDVDLTIPPEWVIE
jgi:hypothetical protein